MNSRTIERLQYFVGKVCSVISTAMNRNFDERIAREHFVVRVAEINSCGIWGTHPYNSELVSFFNLSHLISIHEETELDPNNEEDIKVLKDYEDKTGAKLEGDLMNNPPIRDKKEEPPEEGSESAFIDIQSLEKLAESTRITLDAYERLN